MEVSAAFVLVKQQKSKPRCSRGQGGQIDEDIEVITVDLVKIEPKAGNDICSPYLERLLSFQLNKFVERQGSVT